MAKAKAAPASKTTSAKRVLEPILKASVGEATRDLQALMREAAEGSSGARLAEAAVAAVPRTSGQPVSVKEVLQAVSGDAANHPRLAQVLGEPVPGRIRMPEEPLLGRRPEDESSSTDPRVTSRAVVEAFPREFKVLRDTKLITPDADAAAAQIGFRLEDLFQYLYAIFTRHKAKGEHQGQLSNFFGYLAEIGLATSKEMAAEEAVAVRAALTDTLKIKGIDYDAAQKVIMPFAAEVEADGKTEVLGSAVAALRVLRRYRPAPDVIDIELYTVRDMTGPKGRLVTDRLRGLLDLRDPKKPKFVVIAIGEAKAQSGRAKIIGQIVEDVRRLMKGLRVEGSALGSVTEFGEADVVFGKKLVVGWLSEETPPSSQVANLEKDFAAIFQARNRQLVRAGQPTIEAPTVKVVEVTARTTFDDARKISKDFQLALSALAAKKPSTNE